MLLAAEPAASQGYPTRQIHIIVTFPPGGNADTSRGCIADKLTQTARPARDRGEQARRRLDRRHRRW